MQDTAARQRSLLQTPIKKNETFPTTRTMNQNIHTPSSLAMAAPADETTTAAPPLPDDVLVEIFQFLPAKSVLRFRSICKAWRLLLSDPAFLHEHHRRAPLAILLSNPINNNGDAIYALPFPYTDQSTAVPLYCGTTSQRTYLHGCCDGLLLFSWSCFQAGEVDAAGRNYYRYFVCNPATRELSRLSTDLESVEFIRFVGFYRHAPTEEYRVLGYNYKSSRSIQHHYEYVVAAPGQQSARKLEPNDISTLDTSPVIHRGCLHWMSWLYSEGAMVFDTISEKFLRMRGPVDGDARMDHMPGRLVGLDGTLGASVFVPSEGALKVWVLESYEEETWAFRYSIDVGFLEPKDGPLRFVMLAHVSDDGDLAVILASDRKRCSVYNLRSGEVVSTSHESSHGDHLEGTNYVYQESLVCLQKASVNIIDRST